MANYRHWFANRLQLQNKSQLDTMLVWCVKLADNQI